jgi:acyl-CoA synthetase (AMP-forming)/AMP-acid ligase II
VLRLTPRLVVLLGCAEMGILTSTRGVEGSWMPDTVGHPVRYGELEIVDNRGRLLPPGQVGEIRVKRDGIVNGYFDDPAADARFFRDGGFYPGDLACWSDDGQVLFKGRADDMMVMGGTNIFPVEIENCLQEHPHVVEAIAFPLPSTRHGDVPAAAVRVRGDVSEAELIGFCRERLGRCRPRAVMVVDDFPRNAMGKPLKREMIRMFTEAAQA